MAKINVRVILKFVGMLLCLEAILMLVPYIVALIYGDGDAPALLQSVLITAIT